mgnify:FL=1
MPISRLLKRRMEQGDAAAAAMGQYSSRLAELGEAVDAAGGQAVLDRAWLTAMNEEWLLTATAGGHLDGKNAEMRDAQFGSYLRERPDSQALKERSRAADLAEHRAKREWEVVTLQLQAARAEVALRTAQIAAMGV